MKGLQAAAALMLVATAVAASPRPLQAPIVIDGQFDDWAQVLTNPANTTRDGYGSGTDCTFSTDRDCPVGLDHDLERFAWTWNDTTLYLYVERFQEVPASEGIALYLDMDRSGRMETGEPVLDMRPWQPRHRAVSLKSYVSVDPAGDPLVAPSGPNAGFADGWTLPGGVVNGPTLADLIKDSASATLELALPWADLGLAGPTPFEFHVSAGDGEIPLEVGDNLGSAAGGPSSTGFAAVDLVEPLERSAAPGVPLRLRHVVTNAGTEAGRVNLSAVSSTGWDVGWVADLDGDGVFDDVLAVDAEGDGLFTLPGDLLTPEGDGNGDGLLDTGPLGPFEAMTFELSIVPPPGSNGVIARLDVRGAHERDPAAVGQLEDVVLVGDVTLRPQVDVLAVAGGEAWLPHVLTSNLDAPSTVDLSVLSGSGWPYEIQADPNGDGDPADAVALVDSDGSGDVDVALAPGEEFALLVRGLVPGSASEGQGEFVIVRALLGGVPQATVLDTVEVAPPLQLVPDHLLADGDARYGADGGSVWFPHRLIHARGRSDQFDLAAISDLGWAVSVLLDPDGDGRPLDAVPLPPGPVTLGPNGDELALLLRVDIPPGTPLRETSRLTLTATSTSDAGVSASAEDDAVVAIVRVYEDALHVVNLTRAEPCSTVHAAASGLEASAAGFRFAWFDPTGTLRRQVDVGTDLDGATSDELTLAPGDEGDGWRVEIQSDEGMGHVARDQAVFDVRDELTAGALTLDELVLTTLGSPVGASASLMNESFSGDPVEVALRWVVADATRVSYLSPTGSFEPYWGTEATATDDVSLAPRESQAPWLWLPLVSHPGPGTYVVELWRGTSCGSSETLVDAVEYEVIDDEDGDGVPRDVEEAAGTDPLDADSDDDGLLDGDDGLADSDGDGWIDALDCDSDDDGLSDGLEAGVDTAHADTDVAAGCFTPDADPTTTTDPDQADTDGGGVPDGDEDWNGDGRRDAGEPDPNDPADDAAACAGEAPPEVTGLRVRLVAGSPELSWDEVPADPCTSYTVLWSETLPGFDALAEGLAAPRHVDTAPTAPLRFYLVQTVSSVAGPGPT